MPLAPGTRLGPYEVLTPLGAGGMGEVYRARDTRLGRDVAVKVLTDHLSGDPKALARFQSEARAVAALSHPNILALHDVGESGGVRYAVTELLEGETLRPFVTRGHVPVRRALEIAAQVASALAAAHEKGIVHRDLKPENVFLTKEGHAKLLDFGLARHSPASLPGEDARSPTEPALTEAGAVVGTAAYMSPEQARGLPVDFRSDQFSLGVVLYEMVAGTRPFKGDSAAETMTAIIREEPEPLERKAPSVAPPARWIVQRCLAKEPAERYDSTHDLARDLSACREHLMETASSAGVAAPRPALAHFGTRPAALVSVAGLVVVLAAFATGSYLGWLKPAPPERSFRRLTFRRGVVTEARFAPDGHTVVYSALWDGRPSEVFSVRLDGPDSLQLGYLRAGLLAVSPTSELALLLDPRKPSPDDFFPLGRLAIAPFGGGSPRELDRRITFADWSADGREMLLVRDTGASRQVELPPGRVLYRTAGNVSFPRISPRGGLVAFLDHRVPGNDAGAVAVVDRDGRRRTLTGEFDATGGLAWPPGGNEIWFGGSLRGGRVALRAVTLSGRERVLLSETQGLHVFDVARDGRALVARTEYRRRGIFRRDGETNERDLSCLHTSDLSAISNDGKLAVVDESGVDAASPFLSYLRTTDGAPPTKLGATNAARFSPDGSLVVSIQWEPPAVVLYPVRGGQPRLIPLPGIVVLDAGLAADGRTLWIDGHEPSRGRRSWLTDLDGTRPRPITPEGATSFLTPDGSFFLSSEGGRHRLEPVGGGAPRELVGLTAGELVAGWGPDARWVFVYRGDEIPVRVFRLDTLTGARELVREVAPADPTGVFRVKVTMSPNGKNLGYSYAQWLSELHLVEGLR